MYTNLEEYSKADFNLPVWNLAPSEPNSIIGAGYWLRVKERVYPFKAHIYNCFSTSPVEVGQVVFGWYPTGLSGVGAVDLGTAKGTRVEEIFPPVEPGDYVYYENHHRIR